MNNKKAILVIIIMFFVLLLYFVCFFINEQHKHCVFDIASNDKIIFGTFSEKNAFLNHDVKLTGLELSNQEQLTIPHALRFLSDEENVTTTLYYTDPPKTINISKSFLDEIAFKSMDEFSEAAKWPPLRKVGVPVGSLEIRVWLFRGRGQRIIRLLHHEGKWTGLFSNHANKFQKPVRDGDEWKLEFIEDYLSHPFVPVLALTPQTNWESLWKKLETMGILTLPDSSTLPNDLIIPDGVAYVIEMNDGVQYRVYKFNNPKRQEWPEAVKMIQIIQTLREEFNQSLPKNEPNWF